MKNNKPCKFAANPSGDVWECSVYRTNQCHEQRFDINPYDDSINCVYCNYQKGKEDTTVESGSKKRQGKATPDGSANVDTD